METAYLALRGFVKSPLHFRHRWRVMMGFDFKGWAPTIFSGLLFVMGGVYAAGGFTSAQSKDVQALQTQYREVSLQIDALRAQVAPLASVPGLLQRLSDRLDAAPHADLINTQLSEIQRHLSALDGRSDTDERQQRVDADRAIEGLAATKARLDAIENASKASLGNRR